jgi:ribosomal protein L37AE/L43A
MRNSTMASRLDSLVCPLCEAHKLYPSGQGSMTCQSCRSHLHGSMLETLRYISALPDTLGRHACECGHPEMRLLPDKTYHCPACGSEVPPADVTSTPSKSEENSLAYWAGWADGRYGEKGNLADNRNLPRWESPFDRLTYYRGHRAGSEAYRANNSREAAELNTIAKGG